MNKQQLLKQGGMILAGLVVIVAIILLVTFVIGGSNRMLTSEELALEQTRIAEEILLKQTEIAKTSTAGLYLTLGVPIPTETPFVVPTSGSLGQPTRTPTSASTSETNVNITQSVIRTAVSRPGTATSILQQTQTLTATLTPGQPTLTAATTASPNSGTTQPTEWEGEWIAYFEEGETVQSGILIITVSGKFIYGSMTLEGETMVLSGELLEDGRQALGDYTDQSGSGPFFWELDGESQFKGNKDYRKGFCANRADSSKPDPCLILNFR